MKTLYKLKACLHGTGGSQVSEVVRLGVVTRLSPKNNVSFEFDHVYMIGGVTRHILLHLYLGSPTAM